jgi:autotransporter adhesin
MKSWKGTTKCHDKPTNDILEFIMARIQSTQSTTLTRYPRLAARTALALSAFSLTAIAHAAGTEIGTCASAPDITNIAINGTNSRYCTDAGGTSSIAIGASGKASGAGTGTSASGMTAGNYNQTAMGVGAAATARSATALGAVATASGIGSAALGASATASANSATALGEATVASGAAATAVGALSKATADDATALGRNAQATQSGSVALGANSVADRANAISVGSATLQRQITNVAAGAQDTDAVNFSQLKTAYQNMADTLGGGAGFNNGVWTPPSYAFINGNNYNNVGDALKNLDGRVNTLEQSGGGSGTQNNGMFDGKGNGSGAKTDAAANGNNTTSAGPNSVAIGDNSTAVGSNAQANADNSVALGKDSVADRQSTVSVGAIGNERQIANVMDGTADTDAANMRQLNTAVREGNAQTLKQANDYTDQRFADTNRAIHDVARKAYAGVAAAMAMPNMTPSGPGKTVVAGGVANYAGGSAVGVGVTHRARNSRWMVNVAASVTSTGDVGSRVQAGCEF